MVGEKKIFERTFWKRKRPRLIGVATRRLGGKKTVELYGEKVGYKKEEITEDNLEKHMRDFEGMDRIREYEMGEKSDRNVLEEVVKCVENKDSEEAIVACVENIDEIND